MHIRVTYIKSRSAMINNIIKFSLNNKYLVILLSVALVVFGVRTALNMDIDVFPDLTAPTVVVMTDAHGMASEEVERLVTFPIETSVNGATGVRRASSQITYFFNTNAQLAFFDVFPCFFLFPGVKIPKKRVVYSLISISLQFIAFNTKTIFLQPV